MCKLNLNIPPANLSAVLFRVRQYALDRAVPMGQLAEEAGLGLNTLRKMHTPEWNPTARTLSRLERLVELDRQDFCCD